MQPGVTSDTRQLRAPTARHSRRSSLLRPVVGRRDAVRALIKATALAEAITPRDVIRAARAGGNAPYAFVNGQRWLPAVGLAKLAARLGCDLDAFVALSTRDGETVPATLIKEIARYRHPLAAARIAAGLSVTDAAATSGVNRAVIADFEAGAKIRPGTGRRLRAIFPDNAAVTASVLAQVLPYPHAQETLRRDAVRALIEATAQAESASTRQVIRTAGVGDTDVYAFVTGQRWLPAVGLAKLAARLGCDLDAFVALSTRDGEAVPTETMEQLPRFRHPYAAARIAAGLSVKDLAAATGVSVEVISAVENGARIRPDTGRRLCAVFPDNPTVTASVLAQVALPTHAGDTTGSAFRRDMR